MRRFALAMTLMIAAGAAACGGSGDGAPRGTITVAAASSLTEAFTEIGKDFEATHRGASVEFNFDASSALARQIDNGAPADVFASADEASMAKIVSGGEPEFFASNRLEIATKPGNPNGIRGLDDLADTGTVALCAAEVPCGRLAADVLATAGVVIPENHITRAEKVKAVVTAVAEGDAEAGIAYVTDVIAAGDRLSGVEIPADQNSTAAYPIATLRGAQNATLAGAFVAYVLSDAGQTTLRSYGFGAP